MSSCARGGWGRGGDGHLAEGGDGGHADLEERVRDALEEAVDGAAVPAAHDAGEGPHGCLPRALAARLEVLHDAVEDAGVARDEGAQRLDGGLARRPVAVLEPPHQLRDHVVSGRRGPRPRAEVRPRRPRCELRPRPRGWMGRRGRVERMKTVPWRWRFVAVPLRFAVHTLSLKTWRHPISWRNAEKSPMTRSDWEKLAVRYSFSWRLWLSSCAELLFNSRWP